MRSFDKAIRGLKDCFALPAMTAMQEAQHALNGYCWGATKRKTRRGRGMLQPGISIPGEVVEVKYFK